MSESLPLQPNEQNVEELDVNDPRHPDYLRPEIADAEYALRDHSDGHP